MIVQFSLEIEMTYKFNINDSIKLNLIPFDKFFFFLSFFLCCNKVAMPYVSSTHKMSNTEKTNEAVTQLYQTHFRREMLCRSGHGGLWPGPRRGFCNLRILGCIKSKEARQKQP